MKRLFPCLALVLLLLGCSAKEHISRDVGDLFLYLPEDAKILVVPANDGKFEETYYAGTGRLVGAMLMTSLSPKFEEAKQSESYHPKNKAVSLASTKGFEYVMPIEILHWEDRATPWSWERDKVKIRISVIEVSSGKTLLDDTIEAYSAKYTFEDHRPEDELRRPLRRYASTIFVQ